MLPSHRTASMIRERLRATPLTAHRSPDLFPATTEGVLVRPISQQPSNAQLTDSMRASGTISSPKVVHAFKSTDRGHFLTVGDEPMSNPDAYIDMPLRQGVLHLSAPSI